MSLVNDFLAALDDAAEREHRRTAKPTATRDDRRRAACRRILARPGDTNQHRLARKLLASLDADGGS